MSRQLYSLLTFLALLAAVPAQAAELKAHGIFSSRMVLQRDQPIRIWGWADQDAPVAVTLGADSLQTTATDGRWQVTFPARPATATPVKLVLSSGSQTVTMDQIVIGDVWVMNGQSNMAWPLSKTLESDLAAAQGDLPLLRRFGIRPNEQSTLQTDLPASRIDGDGWTIATRETVGSFSAIGYHFASRVQRALGIPIGIIDNARGGASIESLVPAHKFDDDPIALAYQKHLQERIDAFDPEAEIERQWQQKLKRAKAKGVPEEDWPARPGIDSLRSWSIPGKSPSDAASCYHGMFGVFKGLGIKGVLFHQGYNNAMGTSCRPQRYRVLTRLMIEGWREDFEQPELPVGVIGFCAGSIPQTEDNFEVWSVAPGAFIRESQRLGVADLQDPEHTAFLPAYDIQIPGLHPAKKASHGMRAARWALSQVYDLDLTWDTASLRSVERDGGRMILTFDRPVMPDDMSIAIHGFSIAGPDRQFYRAYATWPMKKDVGIWNTANKCYETTRVIVWSPLVSEPSAVRYAWARCPLGNLKVDGKSWQPLPSFRTDDWDWPEAGPAEQALTRDELKARQRAAATACETRRREEAKRAPEILEQLKSFGRPTE